MLVKYFFQSKLTQNLTFFLCVQKQTVMMLVNTCKHFLKTIQLISPSKYFNVFKSHKVSKFPPVNKINFRSYLEIFNQITEIKLGGPTAGLFLRNTQKRHAATLIFHSNKFFVFIIIKKYKQT